MKHKLLIAAGAAALLAPSLANAQVAVPGPYIKAQFGYGTAGELDFSPAAPSLSGINGDATGDGGWGLGFGAGIEWADNWRLEIEFQTLENDLGRIDDQDGTDSNIRINSSMLNLIYGFNNFPGFKPYVGAGFGLVGADLNASVRDVSGVNSSCSTPAGFVAFNAQRQCDISSQDTNIGWQLIAGAGYDLTPRISWDTEYRYLNGGDFAYEGFVTGGPRFEFLNEVEDVTSHTFLTGIRYRFGEIPAVEEPVRVDPLPPTPVVRTFTCDNGTEVTDLALCPPTLVTCPDGRTQVTDLSNCPPVTYICPDGRTRVTDLSTCPVIVTNTCTSSKREVVNFAFDQGTSAETRNKVTQVLEVGQGCAPSSVRITGHTDTSGPASYNLGLSQRRAKDVRDEMERQGVSPSIIVSEGRGETQPLVNTGDGVRNAQNRRTEILITVSPER